MQIGRGGYRGQDRKRRGEKRGRGRKERIELRVREEEKGHGRSEMGRGLD
jgi:hypothetical protein